MKNKKKFICAIFFIALVIFLAFYTKKYYKQYYFNNIVQEKYKYQYDFAILNKSFTRDLNRSLHLYESFEKYFVDAENTPFYVVVGKDELDLFKNAFTDKNKGAIQRMPNFMTENEVLEKCGEPDVTIQGNWTQQVCKLCFGTLGIAKNYITIDSDTYFTKKFDKSVLFHGDVIKTWASKKGLEQIEADKKYKTYFPTMSCKLNQGIAIDTKLNWYDSLTFIKQFFGGNKIDENYAFVTTHQFFSSDAINRMKKFIKNKGYNFATLIFLIPFEFQWYGEYVLQHEPFFIGEGVFSLIDNESDCIPEEGYDVHYGVTYQAIIYLDPSRCESGQIQCDRKEIIYKRPDHCPVLKK
ncbi:DUF6492 family protein [Rickettsia sp. MEAM1 (Bemisia tabaci)]|uniref:DUF6492 family protein n=1 Tax=Rickettsia sp. MEAM1 (Bemisia tabaci) TaxID=1182263 RepID=UPI0012ED16A2|nr:DUF6492 family protein [Rickettsia sp. MEAM1 (Bemisia tabaci)]